VDPRAGLDNVEKRKFLTLPEFELRPLSRPAAIPTTLSRLFIGVEENSESNRTKGHHEAGSISSGEWSITTTDVSFVSAVGK
jgi:hypothetical protein